MPSFFPQDLWPSTYVAGRTWHDNGMFIRGLKSDVSIGSVSWCTSCPEPTHVCIPEVTDGHTVAESLLVFFERNRVLCKLMRRQA